MSASPISHSQGGQSDLSQHCCKQVNRLAWRSTATHGALQYMHALQHLTLQA